MPDSAIYSESMDFSSYGVSPVPVHFKFKLDEMITKNGLNQKRDEPSIELMQSFKLNAVSKPSEQSPQRGPINLKSLNIDTDILTQNGLVTFTDTTPMLAKKVINVSKPKL